MSAWMLVGLIVAIAVALWLVAKIAGVAMKIVKLIFVVVLIGLVVWLTLRFTRRSGPGEPTAAPLSVSQSLQMVKDDTTNAWQTVKETTTNAWSNVRDSLQSAADATYADKGVYLAKARTDLDALDQKIKEWADKAASATASARTDAQARLQSLRDQRSTLNEKLDAVQNSTAANWDEVKAGFQNSYDKTRTSVKDAWDWLDAKLGS